jgi:hypothetical protein
MRIESTSFRLFIMNVIVAVKRSLFVLLTVTGLALYAVGASNKPCPLPASADDGNTSSTQSPEQPKCMELVMHNGMPICLPCPAADAHIRVHGDADLGPCSKPGNQK